METTRALVAVRTVRALPLCLCLLSAPEARAQSAPTVYPATLGAPAAIGPTGFGAPGQVAISSDFDISFRHQTDTDVSTLTLAPALDYLFAPHVSVGGQVLFKYEKRGTAATRFGLLPRVGYDLPLGDVFSMFAKGGLAISHVSFGGDEATVFSLFFDVPFLFHPVPHFFIGIGPHLEVGLAGSGASAATEIALLSTVGGWFDW